MLYNFEKKYWKYSKTWKITQWQYSIYLSLTIVLIEILRSVQIQTITLFLILENVVCAVFRQQVFCPVGRVV